MRRATPRVRALQAAMVQLTIDDAFASTLYDTQEPLHIPLDDGDYTLTDDDRAMLRGVDRRAWTTDTFRRARLVQTVIDEYLVTTAFVGIREVDAFFSSPALAEVLGRRGALVDAFGPFIVQRTSGTVSATAALEHAIVRARRPHASTAPGYQWAPGTVAVDLPAGTLANWQAARAALGPSPLASIAAGQRLVPPPLPHAREALLIEQQSDGGLGIHPLPPGIAALVVPCSTPQPEAALVRLGKKRNQSRRAVQETLRDLLDEGVLQFHDA